MDVLNLDPLTVTAAQLQKLLAESKVSTVDLVELYLAQIEKHNHRGARLNAIISTAPREDVLKSAQSLDRERELDSVRGPMHGIPIIVKVFESTRLLVKLIQAYFQDSFLTPSLGMETTCGSFALKGQRAIKDATAIEQLLKAGLVVIAKANLSVRYPTIAPWSFR